MLPLFFSFIPFRFLPQLYYVAYGFLPSAPCVFHVLFLLPWGHYPPLETYLTVLLVFRPRPRESPACLGPSLAHFCFPSCDFPRQGSLTAACDYLPHYPLLPPLRGFSSSFYYSFPGSLPSERVPFLLSLLHVMCRTHFLPRVIPQTFRPLCRIRRRPSKLLPLPPPFRRHSYPCSPGSSVCFSSRSSYIYFTFYLKPSCGKHFPGICLHQRNG